MRARTRRIAQQAFLLPVRVRKVGPGRYLGRCSALPGFLVEADSVERVLELAPAVARDLIEAMRAKGVALPKSLSHASAPLSAHLVIAA